MAIIHGIEIDFTKVDREKVSRKIIDSLFSGEIEDDKLHGRVIGWLIDPNNRELKDRLVEEKFMEIVGNQNV